MSIKFSVKELSKIVGISTRNIRYYDDIGLFKCSGTLENGYRYYTIDKIEEIHVINYLRHMGISIKEIKQHLNNRNITEYSSIIGNQLEKVTDEIVKLQRIQHRLKKRLESIDYIRTLKAIGEISVKTLPERRIVKFEKTFESQLDWELTIKQMEAEDDILPNAFIGDIGFFVDMNKVYTRGAEEFIAMFLLAEDTVYDGSKQLAFLEAGKWLCVQVRGDHFVARSQYERLLHYAKEHQLTLKDYAIERTLIDHYISSDPNLYITEILIPIEV